MKRPVYVILGTAASHYPALPFWFQMRIEYRCTQEMRFSQRYWRRRPSSGLGRCVYMFMDSVHMCMDIDISEEIVVLALRTASSNTSS